MEPVRDAFQWDRSARGSGGGRSPNRLLPDSMTPGRAAAIGVASRMAAPSQKPWPSTVSGSLITGTAPAVMQASIVAAGRRPWIARIGDPSGVPSRAAAAYAIAAVASRTANPAANPVGFLSGRRAAASHSTGLFFRGDEQPADAIGVRDDVMDGRDALREPVVCRHQRLSSCRVGRCGQDRVERAEARSFLEQA